MTPEELRVLKAHAALAVFCWRNPEVTDSDLTEMFTRYADDYEIIGTLQDYCETLYRRLLYERTKES